MAKTYNLYLKEIKKKGRGVFCSKTLAAGEVIEMCPVIVIASKYSNAIENTKLSDYCFYFNKEENSLSLVMGFGSMYNYARYPNAAYVLDRDKSIMIYTSLNVIPAHKEITINYGGVYGDDYSKWFADRDIALV
jgi:uncharacterized protein